MGLFLRQDEQRSQLQTKIAADLADRLNQQSLQSDSKKPQSTLLDNQRTTSPLAWAWIIIGVVAVVGAILVLTNPR